MTPGGASTGGERRRAPVDLGSGLRVEVRQALGARRSVWIGVIGYAMYEIARTGEWFE
jgi:hypothetical protein